MNTVDQIVKIVKEHATMLPCLTDVSVYPLEDINSTIVYLENEDQTRVEISSEGDLCVIDSLSEAEVEELLTHTDVCDMYYYHRIFRK